LDPIRTRIDLLCKLYIIYITVSEPRVIGFLVRRVTGGANQTEEGRKNSGADRDVEAAAKRSVQGGRRRRGRARDEGRRVCLVPWSHSPAARRRCLYLVLDDWKRGYSVHRLGEADFVESDARLILDARSSASRRCTSTRRPSRPTGPRSWRCIPSGSAPVSPCSTLSFRCGYCAHSGPCPPQLRARRPGPTQSRSRSMHSKIRVRA